jgi:hypothetical protein
MRFMNAYEIDEARERLRDHPILGPATQTLAALRDCADANSDGWHSWPKPARAAAKLMELILGDDAYEARFGEREDATSARLCAAYAPVKAFRTRQKLDFTIHETHQETLPL